MAPALTSPFIPYWPMTWGNKNKGQSTPLCLPIHQPNIGLIAHTPPQTVAYFLSIMVLPAMLQYSNTRASA